MAQAQHNVFTEDICDELERECLIVDGKKKDRAWLVVSDDDDPTHCQFSLALKVTECRCDA